MSKYFLQLLYLLPTKDQIQHIGAQGILIKHILYYYIIILIWLYNYEWELLFRYMFIEAQSPFGDCGGNITDAENGIIKSPNFPDKYTSSGRGKGWTIKYCKTISNCLWNNQTALFWLCHMKAKLGCWK